MQMNVVRKSILSGTWYSGDAISLKEEIRAYEKQCPEADMTFSRIRGIIAPHAGYIYSGKAAVSAYRHIQSLPYENIIILAPSHSSYFNGIACSSFHCYETPFGKIEVNREYAEKLKDSHSIFTTDIRAEQQEHSAEIHLPFLQYYLKDFRIVPLLAGHLSAGDIPNIRRSMDNILTGRDLVIASTDFTHYGYRFGYNPFDHLKSRTKIRESINRLDMDHIEHIKGLDYSSFLRLKQETGATICGYMPVSVLISLFSGREIKTYLTDYYTSGDITGDYEQAVSYASIIFYE